MGDGTDPSASRRRLSPGARLALAAVALLSTALMLKYAVDIFVIVVVVGGAGFVLHILGFRLAEAGIISLPSFILSVLGIALLAYFTVPRAGVAWETPGWLVAAVHWGETRGWGGRLLFTSVLLDEKAATLTVASFPSETAVGDEVALTVRASGSASVTNRTASFFGGSVFLGSATFRSAGVDSVASLATRKLGVGRHEIRAEVVLQRGVRLSAPPTVHTVRARQK